MSSYPQVYHEAHAHIVAFGGHEFPGHGRKLVAAALRALRAMKRRGLIPTERLQWERDHFHYVGHPVRRRDYSGLFTARRSYHEAPAPRVR